MTFGMASGNGGSGNGNNGNINRGNGNTNGFEVHVPGQKKFGQLGSQHFSVSFESKLFPCISHHAATLERLVDEENVGENLGPLLANKTRVIGVANAQTSDASSMQQGSISPARNRSNSRPKSRTKRETRKPSPQRRGLQVTRRVKSDL